MHPLQDPGTVRITIEAADPATARRAAHQIARMCAATGPSPAVPVPGEDHTRLWLYARPDDHPPADGPTG
ncbi:DUF6207 family protein [Streptomyces cacaoi]|uniref:DUF6207 family protein n=1 Tax=Streptomyces cacaoi TaxID=1898 RepID=UPI00261F0839|nr:DUF6207 family protein [Streptomyces cacaoi]